jgi:hypothetical protein
MKRILFLFLITLTLSANAQNIQILNGIALNKDKDYVNFATFETYKSFEHASLYYFTDFKIDEYGNNIETYSEISYYKNIWKTLSITGQYNAGLNDEFQIKPVYLLGLSKTTVIENLILSFDVLYRIDRYKDDSTKTKIGNGIQLTGTFLRDWKHFQFSGYCDLWQTANSKLYNKKENPLIVLFEPQLWWKFSKRIYLGLEGRVSNFNSDDIGLSTYTNYVMLGIKLNLE